MMRGNIREQAALLLQIIASNRISAVPDLFPELVGCQCPQHLDWVLNVYYNLKFSKAAVSLAQDAWQFLASAAEAEAAVRTGWLR